MQRHHRTHRIMTPCNEGEVGVEASLHEDCLKSRKRTLTAGGHGEICSSSNNKEKDLEEEVWRKKEEIKKWEEEWKTQMGGELQEKENQKMEEAK